MMTTLLWIIVIGGIILLAKRIGAGMVGVAMFGGAIFFSIFMLDTFTVFKVRDYVDVGFYDETVEDPQGAAIKVKDTLVEGGNTVIDKINDVGEKAQNRYDTNSIVKNGGVEQGSTEVEYTEEKEDEPAARPAAPDEEPDEAPAAVAKEPQSSDDGDVPMLEGFTYLTLQDHKANQDQYSNRMTPRDFGIYKALSPLITITYEGDEYTFATVRGVKGVYIKEK